MLMIATKDNASQAGNKLPQVAGRRVIVCDGTGCRVNGSQVVYDAFFKCIVDTGAKAVVQFKSESKNGDIPVTRSGCQGMCSQALW